MQLDAGARERCGRARLSPLSAARSPRSTEPFRHSTTPPLDQDEWPLLAIVPASLRLVWAEELEKWLPHLRPGRVRVIEGRDDRICLQQAAAAAGGVQPGAGGGNPQDAGGGGGPEAPGGAPAAAAAGAAAARDPDAIRALMPAVTITSYEMMKRLSCEACQKGAACGGGGGGGVGGGGGGGRGRGRGGADRGAGRAGGGGGGGAAGPPAEEDGGQAGAPAAPLECLGPGECAE